MSYVSYVTHTDRLSRSSRRRKGAALVLVVLSMIVLTAIVGAMFRLLAISNRQVKQRARKAQATLLAESAIERGVFKLQKDSNYERETWTIPASELGQRFGGKVDIEVTESEDDSHLISVTAAYPDRSDFRATVRKSIKVAASKLTSDDKNGE